MSASYRKNLKKIAKQRGWSIEPTRNGHLKLAKRGCPDLRCSYSPRSDTALKAVERDMDRAEGLVSTGWAATG
jgi:hypothetical protein